MAALQMIGNLSLGQFGLAWSQNRCLHSQPYLYTYCGKKQKTKKSLILKTQAKHWARGRVAP